MWVLKQPQKCFGHPNSTPKIHMPAIARHRDFFVFFLYLHILYLCQEAGDFLFLWRDTAVLAAKTLVPSGWYQRQIDIEPLCCFLSQWEILYLPPSPACFILLLRCNRRRWQQLDGRGIRENTACYGGQTTRGKQIP